MSVTASPMSDESDRNRLAAECFRKCNEAAHKQNYDYAIDMATKAVRFAPGNLLYRQALRGVEERKYNNNKTGAGMGGKIKLAGIRTRISRARMKSDWQTLDIASEDGLALNPWDAQLNADLGDACHNLGHPEVAIFAYERAVAHDPNNKGYLEKLAGLYENRGRYPDAINCWKRVSKIDPLDSQARSRATQLEAMNTMERGGYEGAQSTLDVKTGYDFDRPRKSTVPDDATGPGMSVEADLQRAIRKNPADKNNYLKLGDFYSRERNLQQAFEIYKKALEVSGGDPDIRERMEDVELEQMQENVDSARQTAATDPVANKNYHDWKSELRKRSIEVYSARVDRYPKDSSLKYKLAKEYIKLKEYKKAIPLLQQSSADVRLKGEVLVDLAKCFLAENNKLLALRQYQAAIQVINPHDKQELFVDAHYGLGRLYEDSKDVPKAVEHYTEVLALDYGYKDTRERLDRLQRGG